MSHAGRRGRPVDFTWPPVNHHCTSPPVNHRGLNTVLLLLVGLAIGVGAAALEP